MASLPHSVIKTTNGAAPLVDPIEENSCSSSGGEEAASPTPFTAIRGSPPWTWAEKTKSSAVVWRRQKLGLFLVVGVIFTAISGFLVVGLGVYVNPPSPHEDDHRGKLTPTPEVAPMLVEVVGPQSPHEDTIDVPQISFFERRAESPADDAPIYNPRVHQLLARWARSEVGYVPRPEKETCESALHHDERFCSSKDWVANPANGKKLCEGPGHCNNEKAKDLELCCLAQATGKVNLKLDPCSPSC